MKSAVIGSWLVFIGLLALNSNTGFAQGRFTLRLVPKTIDCVNNKVEACVEIRAVSKDSAFVMGNANLRVFYKSAQLTGPTIKSRNNFTSAISTAYSTMGFLSNPGADTSIVTLNILYNGENGQGTTVDTTWLSVACLEFSIAGANATKCYDLFSLPKDFSLSLPNTVITRAYHSPTNDDPTRTLTAEVNGTFINIANQCSLPIVAIAGDTTINNGGTATLTLTSQNNIFPATINLTGGTSVQLTQANPVKTVTVSPTTQTTYQILSVAGACGAGSAASGKSQVVVQVSQPQNCPPAKCIPLTFRIVK